MEKKIIGRCPLCGGNVVKTCKGYRCENNIAEQPTCVLNINGIIGNRKMSNEEITELLEYRFILLDGFASKEGKAFPSVLELADNGAINMQSIIGKCPHCGGDMGGYESLQLLQLQQPAGAVQLCRLAQHRWPPVELDRSQGNL